MNVQPMKGRAVGKALRISRGKGVAISGAGFVAANAAGTSPAASAAPRRHPELTTPFPRPPGGNEMRNAVRLVAKRDDPEGEHAAREG